MKMNPVSGCDMTNCAYNKNNRCHTLGITVGPHAECNTFVHASARGGYDDANGGVGACLASGCTFNDRLECKAAAIDVVTHDKHPDCRTFQPKN